jgi:hypothetical protein
MRKLWLPKVGGVKIENVVTLGSLFLNIEKSLDVAPLLLEFQDDL